MNAITLEHITKTYNKGTVTAVDDVSFSIKEGEIFGLIGPDGAGKSTIFRLLTTLLLPDKGTATVGGYDVVKDFKAIRGILGYMPGKFSLYQDLSVEENLEFFATVFNTTIEENYELIKDIYVQLEPFKDRRAGKLSGGMKQKLALCCALIHKPKVLFLDEPTTGVDVVSRREFWEMLKRYKQQGITIMVSTSYMDEASLCDRIALILNGKILSIASPADTIKSFPDKLYALKSPNMYRLLTDLRSFDGTRNCYTFGEYLHLTIKCSEEEIKKLLQDKGHTDVEFKVITPTVEDSFIGLLKEREQ